MTLNLTLLTADAIYQSADFQLTDGSTNAPLHIESMKLVTVHYPSWEGFVSYTGIGRWRGRDTAEWIVEWLTGLEDASPDGVIDRVRERGTAFLRDIENSPLGGVIHTPSSSRLSSTVGHEWPRYRTSKTAVGVVMNRPQRSSALIHARCVNGLSCLRLAGSAPSDEHPAASSSVWPRDPTFRQLESGMHSLR
jgi:hypothetical protein